MFSHSPSRARASSVRAFTLVELLVVIGMIAMLVGILMPTLGRARAAAQAANCLSNLRQINTAFLLFAQDNKGYLPQIGSSGLGSEPYVIGGTSQTVLVRWFGGLYGTPQKFYPDAAMLRKYWGTANVAGCPTFGIGDVFRPQYGPVDYAYNSIYARHKDWALGGVLRTGLGVKLAKIKNSSNKALVWDSARIEVNTIDRTPWGYPTTGNVNNNKTDPNFNGRHNRKGNIGFVDGHVGAEEPAYFTSYNGGQDPSLLLKLKIGDIDRDKDQTTNEMYTVE